MNTGMVTGTLGMNKFEKILLASMVVIAILCTTVSVVWLAREFGIHLTTSKMNKILDALANGASLGTAFAIIAGVTLPAWALAAAGALGATAA
ncbi:MAG: class IIc cyclic bacteriocin [Ectobacillus sp.]|jgi:hypothetical protein